MGSSLLCLMPVGIARPPRAWTGADNRTTQISNNKTDSGTAGQRRTTKTGRTERRTDNGDGTDGRIEADDDGTQRDGRTEDEDDETDTTGRTD